MNNFERITIDPLQMGGLPCVRHLRIPVGTVLGLLAGGLEAGATLREYPDLEQEDIRECLRLAAAAVMNGNYHFRNPREVPHRYCTATPHC
jgi:uncharacterized protein (DUF433 family)